MITDIRSPTGSLQRFRHRQGWKTFAEAAETYGPVSVLRGIMGVSLETADMEDDERTE